MKLFGSFLKKSMIAFNFIICLAGAALLLLGFWIRFDGGTFLTVLDEIGDAPREVRLLMNVSYLMMGLGGALFVIGYLGYRGTRKESRPMLLCYFVIVLVLFLAQGMIAAVTLGMNSTWTENLLTQVSNKALANLKHVYGDSDKDELTNLWDTTMARLHCCAVNDYRDFIGSRFYNLTSSFPCRCCFPKVEGEDKCDNQHENICDEQLADVAKDTIIGCLPRLRALIQSNFIYIAFAALVLLAVELCAMAVSMTLYFKIEEKQNKKRIKKAERNAAKGL